MRKIGSPIFVDKDGKVVEMPAEKEKKAPKKSTKDKDRMVNSVATGVATLLTGMAYIGSAAASDTTTTKSSTNSSYNKEVINMRISDIEREVNRILESMVHYDGTIWSNDLDRLKLNASTDLCCKDGYVTRHIAYSLIFIAINEYCDESRVRQIPVEGIRRIVYRILDSLDERSRRYDRYSYDRR